MLSDEEKKAIEFVKSELQDEKIIRNDYQSLTGLYGNLEIETILNLIEKQSKEIEELKEKNKITKQMNENLIEALKESISKDKIKAKIEEYDDKGMTVNLANRGAGKTFQQAVHYEVKEVLQSLLEKED